MSSYEEMRAILDEVKRESKERAERKAEERRKELESMGITPIHIDESKKCYDHPNTMENSTATFFWIVVMIVGVIFKDRWMIWIIATVIWAKFITRHGK